MGFEESRLWQEGLAHRADDQHAIEREKLRVQLRAFREGAAIVAAEIARDLPYFTVHDVRHLDALWDLAGEIAGPEVTFTPTELFVLGGAFLIHDLGMASASYPEGPASIEELPAWPGVLATMLRRSLGREPTGAELADPPEESRREAMETLLRQRHAAQAELLVREPLVCDAENSRYLLEDAELRDSFARMIGRVAHSHWWPLESLPERFPTKQNAPADFPREWEIDPLKLACLLRVADAAHLDKLRAPSLLRRLRNPPDISNDHWVFQGALDPASCDKGRLRFTASHAFPPGNSAAWWLCLDALRVADSELRQVDALLADLNRQRFAARGISGVDSPDRFAELVPTEDWLPKETSIKISDATRVIDRLGGAKLYGNQLGVPLRELIQNATDAVMLRRQLEGTSEPITVTLEQVQGKQVLTVTDHGVGMSPAVLTGSLLDFGDSLWSSDAFIDEFSDYPIDFRPIGTFGIGFFSIFMWSDQIEVASRRFDAGAEDTHILELKSRSINRPLLRRASKKERLVKPGTSVKLTLDNSLLELSGGRRNETLAALCGRLAPSSRVPIIAQDVDGDRCIAVLASDWIVMPPVGFLNRLVGEHPGHPNALIQVHDIAKNLRLLQGPDGISGRMALIPISYYLGEMVGVLTVGGMRSAGIRGFAGILEGIEPTAARNEAHTAIDQAEIAAWASTQADLLMELHLDPLSAMAAAAVVGQLGGDPGRLAVCRTADGDLSFKELMQWVKEREEVWLLDLSYRDSEFYERAGSAEYFEPARNVVAYYVSGEKAPDILAAPSEPASPLLQIKFRSIRHLIEEALAAGWGLPPLAQVIPSDGELEAFWDGEARFVGKVSGREISTSYITPASPRFALGFHLEQE